MYTAYAPFSPPNTITQMSFLVAEVKLEDLLELQAILNDEQRVQKYDLNYYYVYYGLGPCWTYKQRQRLYSKLKGTPLPLFLPC